MKISYDAEPARETFTLIRQSLRAPLRRAISCAELLYEHSKDDAVSEVMGILTRLLEQCQAAVDLTFVETGAPEGEAQVQLRSTCATLLIGTPGLLQSASALADVLSHSQTNELTQAVKITDALRAYESLLQTLSSQFLQGTELSPSTLLGATSSVREVLGGSLIAQVEYWGLILVVDDDEGNRDLLSRRLMRDGYEVMLAESGNQALRMLHRYSFDLVLLDIMMPETDGIAVLEEMKKHQHLRQLPVVMVTAVDEIEMIAHCLESGADDYLMKPFNPVLLRARVGALLHRKRHHDDQVRQRLELESILQESARQRRQSESLLLNILPPTVAAELQESGSVKPMYFEDVTIVFADVVGFTQSTEELPADELVETLHQHFTQCDRIVSDHGLEKLKTIGDCYMFAGGLPTRSSSHPVDCVLAALEFHEAMDRLRSTRAIDWRLRIGIHSGAVIAGVVGIHKFAFDIWGEAVNFTSRVEALGSPGRVNISSSTFSRVKDFFDCERRPQLQVKEGKAFDMYFVRGAARGLIGKAEQSGPEAFDARYQSYFRKRPRGVSESLFPPHAAEFDSTGFETRSKPDAQKA